MGFEPRNARSPLSTPTAVRTRPSCRRRSPSSSPAAPGRSGSSVSQVRCASRCTPATRPCASSAPTTRSPRPGSSGTLLTVLAARNLVPGDDQLAAIRACRDPAVLQRWLARAAVATSLSGVFD